MNTIDPECPDSAPFGRLPARFPRRQEPAEEEEEEENEDDDNEDDDNDDTPDGGYSE